MPKRAEQDTEKKQQSIIVDGTTYTLKEKNGLPIGLNLYWQARGGNRYIYTKLDGHGLSCGTTDVKAAVRFVLAKRKERAEADSDIPVDHLTINDLLNSYLDHLHTKNLGRGEYNPQTAKFTALVLKAHVRPFFGELKVAQLIKLPKKQKEYRIRRTKELCEKMGKTTDKVQNTIDKEIGHVRAAYNLAVKENQIPRAIVPIFPIDKENSRKGARTGMFNDTQYETLMEQLPDPVKRMFALCNSVAVRKKEATFIHRSEVNWEHRVIRLRAIETKKGKERYIPIPKKIFPILWEWEERTRKEHPKAEYVFHLEGQRMTTEQLDDIYYRTCQDLGWHKHRVDEEGNVVLGKNGDPLWDRSPMWHDSRRTAATLIHNLDGVTPIDAQRTLGMTEQTQMRYDQNNSALKLRDALDKHHDNGSTRNGNRATTDEKAGADLRTRLAELKALFDDGLIEADEYKQAKMRLLMPA